MKMQRFQIYLPEDLSIELKLLAKREQKPTAQIIRTVLHAGLNQKNKKKKNAGDFLLNLAKMGEKSNMKTPDDLSTNLIDYLYGEKSEYATHKRK